MRTVKDIKFDKDTILGLVEKFGDSGGFVAKKGLDWERDHEKDA